MTTAYHMIPHFASCAEKLRAYFAKQKVAHDALLAALKRWGASNVRIYGEGRDTALTKMQDKPGWKLIKKHGYYRPDTKTTEGKAIAEEMKALPTLGIRPQELSGDVLGHGLLCWSHGGGLAIHYAVFAECAGGYVMASDTKMKSKCERWPEDAVEITASEFERLTTQPKGDQ